MADLPKDAEGSLQYGTRPVLVISNNQADFHPSVTTIIPLTIHTHKKKPLPTHVAISRCGLEKKTINYTRGTDYVNKQKSAEKESREHLRNSI